jgi:hypothetical protein
LATVAVFFFSPKKSESKEDMAVTSHQTRA